jgi:hemolysin III
MRIQSPFEEKLNAITHAIGALFGIVALVLLIVFDSHKTNWSLFSVIVYGKNNLHLLENSCHTDR